MDTTITLKITELVGELIIAGIGAGLGAFLAIQFGFKKSFNETLGARVVERKVELYDELLDTAFKIRLNKKLLFDSRYLTNLFSLIPRCRILASSDVRVKYEKLFNYLKGLRTQYASANAKLEDEHFAWVPARDYYGSDDDGEVQIPLFPDASDCYERKRSDLKKEFLPAYKKLDRLLEELTSAISFDFNQE